MKTRILALLVAVAVAVAAVVLWRRRSSGPAEPLVQLGLSNGAVHTLEHSDSSTIELETLAAGVRDSFTGGA